VNQSFDTGAFMLGPQRLDELAACFRDIGFGGSRKPGRFDERGQAFCLGSAIGCGDGLPELRLSADRRREICKWLGALGVGKGLQGGRHGYTFWMSDSDGLAGFGDTIERNVVSRGAEVGDSRVTLNVRVTALFDASSQAKWKQFSMP
jgi:hypothetical protein